MKRFFYFIFIAATLVAGCSKITEEPEPDPFGGASYKGVVSVEFAGADYDNSDILVDVTPDEGAGTLTIDIHQIKFVPQMPVTVDVTVPGVSYSEKGGVLTFSGDGIIPLSGVVPVERYLVSGLTGTIKEDSCTFSLNFGSYPTKFTGSKVR